MSILNDPQFMDKFRTAADQMNDDQFCDFLEGLANTVQRENRARARAERAAQPRVPTGAALRKQQARERAALYRKP